jgi:hypothetical protein
LDPPDRVIVPRSLAFALPDAIRLPLAGTGGQALAHAPVHSDLFMLSLSHRYTERPDPSVRYVPAEPDLVLITVPEPVALLELEADALALDPDPLGLVLLLLLHAAASSAAASGTPSLTPTDSFVRNELLIFIPSVWSSRDVYAGVPLLSSCLLT